MFDQIYFAKAIENHIEIKRNEEILNQSLPVSA